MHESVLCVCELMLVKLENLCVVYVLWFCMCRLSVKTIMVDDEEDPD